MNENWLNQLAPEHAPQAVGWWPPAPGWWIVFAVTLVLLAVAWRQRTSFTQAYRTQRRAALHELQRIRAQRQGIVATASAIENVLRRYALSAFGHERVARLSGEAWLAFVVEQGGEEWAGDTGRGLLAAAFGGVIRGDPRERWLAAAEAFVKRAPRRGSRSASAP